MVEANIKRVTPEEAKELLESEEGYVYLDVRTVSEFEAGHVPGAKNVPVFEPSPFGRGMAPNPRFVEIVEGSFGKDVKCITGCEKGGRSLQAAHLLLRSGFTNVVDMRGGFGGETDPMGQVTFPGWSTRGLPTTTESPSEDTYKALSKANGVGPQ